MGKLTGVVLTAVGLAVGVYAVYSYERNEHRTITVAAVPSPANLATAQIDTSDRAKPDSQLSATERLRATPASEDKVALSPRVPALDIRSPSSGGTPRVPVGRQMPAVEEPMDHMGLTRELQRQLKRVACYEGEINGMWTPSTRRAMKAFIDRVNATLPIEQPDPILLAIVQNHQGSACGTPCPAGQGLTPEGRCLPNGIMARAARNPAPVDDRGSSSAVAAAASGDPVPIAPGRMGLAGPQPEPSPLPTEAARGEATHDAPPAKSARPPGNFASRARERLQEREWVRRAFPNSIF